MLPCNTTSMGVISAGMAAYIFAQSTNKTAKSTKLQVIAMNLSGWNGASITWEHSRKISRFK